MQSNLHRVSESAIATKSDTEDSAAKFETKISVKRLREPESDTESEVDDMAVTGHIASPTSDFRAQGHATSDSWQDSPKPDSVEVDPTVFLSFDWQNEGPYEKAVDRCVCMCACVRARACFS